VIRRLARTDPDQACSRRAGLLRPARHSNGPTEAINGRLEHLRGSALGFRNLTNYIARFLSNPADSDADYTPDCEEPFPRWHTVLTLITEASDGFAEEVAQLCRVADAPDGDGAHRLTNLP
jgi:hypothetical protein